MTDHKKLLQQALLEIEAYWWKVDSEWGPSESGLERAILRGEEPVISALRAAIAQPAPDADDDAMRSPAYNFDSVNKFVHESDAQYEELQALCLGLVSKLERKQAVQPEQTRPTITAYLTRHDTGDMLFFDKAEAQQYCDDDSEPEPLMLLSAIAQPKLPKSEWHELSNSDRQQVFESLPNMLDGFLKTWGWLHFAKGIEAKCREKNIAQPKDKP